MIDDIKHRCLEQGLRCDIFPVLVVWGEDKIVEMANNTGHHDRAVTPWLVKGEFEFIVLYILISGDVSLRRSHER